MSQLIFGRGRFAGVGSLRSVSRWTVAAVLALVPPVVVVVVMQRWFVAGLTEGEK